MHLKGYYIDCVTGWISMDKIIVITSNIAPYRLKWCEELARFYDVTVAYTKDHDFERDDRWLKNSSEYCHIKKLKNDSNIYDPLCFDVIDLIKNNPDSLLIFDGYGPKTNLLGILYCFIRKRFNIVNVDGYPTERKKSSVKEIVKKIIIGKLCSYFFCSGKGARDYLKSYGAKDDNICVHNFSSIDEKDIVSKPISRTVKNRIRRELNIDTDKRIVLGAGRFLKLKRFDDLIKAVLKAKRDCVLYLVGGKPNQEYLDLVKDSDKVRFVDFVMPEDVAKYYKAADLFVLPSDTDVWGLVLNEAMAQGLPVIASDSVVAGMDLIDGNGKIFKTYDVDELSKDIDYCLDDKTNTRMSKRSIEIIRNFTIQGMVERQRPVIDSFFKKAKL